MSTTPTAAASVAALVLLTVVTASKGLCSTPALGPPPTSPFTKSALKMSPLTDAQKRAFVRDGYIIIRNAVPEPLLQRAEVFLDDAQNAGRCRADGPNKRGSSAPNMDFRVPERRSPPITDLLLKSGLMPYADDLLDGCAILRHGQAQVAYTPTSDVFRDEGMAIDEPHLTRWWHIDSPKGDYLELGSDFFFLFGVALSDGQQYDENRGQLMVYPGSHTVTHDALRRVAATKPEELMKTFRQSKPDVGKPVRALLARGDAIIKHQRVAHAPGINLSTVTRKNIYFRIIHRDHDDLVRKHLHAPTPWTGFYGLREFLPEGATEGK